MQPIPAFNPGDTVAYPNGLGTIQVGAADAGSKMLLYNESPFNLNIDFLNGSQSILHAWEARYWTLDGDTRQVEWDINSALSVVSSPISLVIGELYGASERLEGTYPMGLIRQTNVGNIGGVTTTSPSNVFYNVKDPAYGAVGDGISDDTAAIAAARSACNTAGGGTVYYPHGTYVTGNLIDYDNVTDMGDGIGATTLLLKAGSNTDLFGSRFTANINLTGTAGSGSASASTKWCIRDMTLDGNKANQTGGTSYVMRVYAYAYKLINVHITNGYTGGILRDYYGPFPADWIMESMWENLQVTLNNGIGVQLGGPTDSQWVNGIVNSSVSHNIHITPHASQMLFENVHAYTNSPQPNANACAWLIEAGASCINCIAETSGAVQIALITNNIFRWIGGSIFAGAYAGTGIQIGQAAGNTPFLGQINQAAGVTTALTAAQYYFSGIMLQNISNVNGYIQFVGDGGGYINAIAYRPAGSPAFYTGTVSAHTTLEVTQLSITPNGTLVNDGGIRNASGIFNVASGVKHSFQVNNVEKAFVDASGLTVPGGNNISGDSGNNLDINVPSASKFVRLLNNGVDVLDVTNVGPRLGTGMSYQFIVGTMSRQNGNGSTTCNGGTTISHGLGTTPALVLATPNIAQAGSATVGIGNLGATTFQATVGAGTLISWWCIAG